MVAPIWSISPVPDPNPVAIPASGLRLYRPPAGLFETLSIFYFFFIIDLGFFGLPTKFGDYSILCTWASEMKTLRSREMSRPKIIKPKDSGQLGLAMQRYGRMSRLISNSM